VARVNVAEEPRLDRWMERYESALVLSLLSSIFLAGSGRVALFSGALSVSAWSISRTTFVFWLIWKIAAAVRGRRGALGFLEHGIPWALLIFLITVAISLLPDFHAGGDFRYFLFGCFHAVMIMDLFADRARLRRLWPFLALTPALLTVRGILHNPALLDFAPAPYLPLDDRLGFPLDHPNTAGYLLSMSIPLAATLFVAKSGWAGVLIAISCAAQVFGLVLTYSRGAWLGWGAAMIFLAIMSKRWKTVIALTAVPLFLFLFVEPLRSRVMSLADPASDRAMSDRIRVMRDALDLGYQNPVGGIGYGRGRLKQALRGENQEVASEGSEIWHTHNVFIEIFAGTGLVGLAAFLWLLARTGFDIVDAAERAAGERVLLIGLGAAWVAAAVTGLGDIPFYHHETRIYFFTLLALAFAWGKVVDLRAASE
jgi:O-antigen ligase